MLELEHLWPGRWNNFHVYFHSRFLTAVTIGVLNIVFITFMALTHSVSLAFGKHCFMLHMWHLYRKQRNAAIKELYDFEKEHGPPPTSDTANNSGRSSPVLVCGYSVWQNTQNTVIYVCASMILKETFILIKISCFILLARGKQITGFGIEIKGIKYL